MVVKQTQPGPAHSGWQPDLFESGAAAGFHVPMPQVLDKGWCRPIINYAGGAVKRASLLQASSRTPSAAAVGKVVIAE